MTTLPQPTAGEHHARRTFPTVVLSTDTGADFDSLLSLLTGWDVRVFTFDGYTFEGTVKNEVNDDRIHLFDEYEAGIEVAIGLDHVERIQVL
jgi:hypothetical protein